MTRARVQVQTQTDKSRSLLPKGFEDLLPPAAEKEAQAQQSLLNSFAMYGYQRIKPPLLEFEENLFSGGPGAALQDYSFRVMDPVSFKMMGLRADMTAQIARIASTRMVEEERPLRLMYANDVLRTRTGESHDLRQYSQVGVELIGVDDVRADIEVIVIAVQSLLALGVPGLTIDLSVPALVDHVLDACDVSEADHARLREVLNMRDHVALADFDQVSDVLSQLLGADIDHVHDIEMPEKARNLVADVRAVFDGVHAALAQLDVRGVHITVNFCENTGFEYHHGVCFSVFADGAGHEVCRGGRYLLSHGGGGSSESATGFSVFTNQLRGLLGGVTVPDVKDVEADENWGRVKELQAQGLVVRRRLA